MVNKCFPTNCCMGLNCDFSTLLMIPHADLILFMSAWLWSSRLQTQTLCLEMGERKAHVETSEHGDEPRQKRNLYFLLVSSGRQISWPRFKSSRRWLSPLVPQARRSSSLHRRSCLFTSAPGCGDWGRCEHRPSTRGGRGCCFTSSYPYLLLPGLKGNLIFSSLAEKWLEIFLKT